MKPEIFMDDFERTEDGDRLFSSLGRALTLATRFESNCRGLAAILQMKANSSAVLETDEALKEFSEKLYKRTLDHHIKSSVVAESELHKLLNRARIARNEIAHELPLGLCSQEGLDRLGEDVDAGIKELVATIAEADRAVCFVLTDITNDHMPTNEFLKSYVDRATAWVCEE